MFVRHLPVSTTIEERREEKEIERKRERSKKREAARRKEAKTNIYTVELHGSSRLLETPPGEASK